jgi:DNA-binding NarL/FixJ family response regulator
MKIRIYLIDDHRILREGIAALISAQAGMTVVGQAGNGHDGLVGIQATRPDLVILDISMPSLNGIEVARRLHKDLPTVKVLVLSMQSDRRFVSGALGAGASGYLLKETAAEELIRAVQIVASGQVYVSSAIAELMVQEFREKSAPVEASSATPLTTREREVLQLLVEGLSAKEVAAKLGLSVKTAESHRSNLMSKLDLTSIADLTKYALREGIISL